MKTTKALYEATRAVGKLGRAMEEDMIVSQTHTSSWELVRMDLSDLKRLQRLHKLVVEVYDDLVKVADSFGRDRSER